MTNLNYQVDDVFCTAVSAERLRVDAIHNHYDGARQADHIRSIPHQSNQHGNEERTNGATDGSACAPLSSGWRCRSHDHLSTAFFSVHCPTELNHRTSEQLFLITWFGGPVGYCILSDNFRVGRRHPTGLFRFPTCSFAWGWRISNAAFCCWCWSKRTSYSSSFRPTRLAVRIFRLFPPCNVLRNVLIDTGSYPHRSSCVGICKHISPSFFSKIWVRNLMCLINSSIDMMDAYHQETPVHDCHAWYLQPSSSHCNRVRKMLLTFLRLPPSFSELCKMFSRFSVVMNITVVVGASVGFLQSASTTAPHS